MHEDTKIFWKMIESKGSTLIERKSTNLFLKAITFPNAIKGIQ